MVKRLSLNGKWEFREAGKSGWRNAAVPGTVQQDLMRLRKMPDPYYRLNETKYRELEPLRWEYRKIFFISAEQAGHPGIELALDGLDTYCAVRLNGQLLGRADNMFIPWRFSAKKALKRGRNELVISFDSSLKVLEGIGRKTPRKYRVNEFQDRIFGRKAQYSFGWDWGPRVAQTGIWKDVYLEFGGKRGLENLCVRTTGISVARAELAIGCSLSGRGPGLAEIETVISFKGRTVEKTRGMVKNGEYSDSLLIAQPRLWYPSGLGAQEIYRAEFNLFIDGKKTDSKAVKFGIRSVRLKQKPDKEGKSFVFEINGKKVFCKGANWIPSDCLLPRVSPEDYRGLVETARQANMNMLRVWGGGIYEHDAFYEACDEKGIMVWQDFMYACAQYPDEYEWFRKLAQDEAESVVKRLRNHPSIVCWCGNNENNWAFYHWWGMKTPPKYLGNHIYTKILPEVCGRLVPDVPYWVSSPFGGIDPNSQGEGDRHNWAVWGEWKNKSEYLKDKGRFISEFGFQSLPAWKTVLAFTKPEDRDIRGKAVMAHNKMPEGTERVEKYTRETFGEPADFKAWVYLTQFNQAEAMKTGIEHWRSRMFKTAGTLYWQLNDCWPVASWSCVDYFKRKKALWYYSRRFYAPILAAFRYEDGKLSFFAVNETGERLKARVKIQVYSLSGEPGYREEFDLNLPALDVVRRYLPEIKTGKDAVVFVDMEAGGRKSSNYIVFDVFKNLKLEKAAFKLKKTGNSLILSADKPAFGVFIETERDVDVSDNCLNMEPGRKYTVKFSGNPGKIKVFGVKELVR